MSALHFLRKIKNPRCTGICSPVAHHSQCTFFSNIEGNIRLVAWNWPQWEYLYNGNWQTLQIRALFSLFEESLVKHLPVHTWHNTEISCMTYTNSNSSQTNMSILIKTAIVFSLGWVLFWMKTYTSNLFHIRHEGIEVSAILFFQFIQDTQKVCCISLETFQ